MNTAALGCDDSPSQIEPDAGINRTIDSGTDAAEAPAPDASTEEDAGAAEIEDASVDAAAAMDWYPEFDVDPGPDQSDETFTVCWYQDADNNLERALLEDVNEAEESAIPQNVTLIVLIDRSKGYNNKDGNWTGAKLFRLQHDETPMVLASERLADPDFLELTDDSENGEELDMGSKDTLEAFLEFCTTRYPADHTFLHISDHGDGWRREIGAEQETPGPMRATCNDNDPVKGSALTISEDLPAALDGKGIEALTFDACLMGTVEVAWALAPHVDFFGASLMSIPEDGFSYREFLNKWYEHMSARNWVLAAVDEYKAAYDGTPNVGYTAVDLRNIEVFAAALDELVSALEGLPIEVLRPMRNGSYRPDMLTGMSMRDPISFAQNSAKHIGVQPVLDLYASFDPLIMSYWYAKNLKWTRGLTIYFPGRHILQGGPFMPAYDKTPFARDTTWDDLVHAAL